MCTVNVSLDLHSAKFDSGAQRDVATAIMYACMEVFGGAKHAQHMGLSFGQRVR